MISKKSGFAVQVQPDYAALHKSKEIYVALFKRILKIQYS